MLIMDGLERTAELDAFLTLNLSGLTPQRQLGLLDAWGSAQCILDASDNDLLQSGLRDRLQVNKLRTAQREIDLSVVYELCIRYNIRPVPLTSPEYPQLLKETSDVTPLLYVQGAFKPRDDMSVAIVGTRKCSAYALMMARKLGHDLAKRGFTIISGLALGVDAEAHRGALEAGGRTVAVMASGADITYPSDHRALRNDIASSGAVVTEYAFGTQPLRERFPARNRLVSGMSLGVLVVEAPLKSGALITAGLAGEQGREVFAVPGDVTRPESRGCHALIKDGARLVEFAEDVVEGLGILLQAVPERVQVPSVDLPEEERHIYDALTFQPRNVDDVVAQCGLPAAKVSAGLMLLEMKGLVRRLPGGLFVRL